MKKQEIMQRAHFGGFNEGKNDKNINFIARYFPSFPFLTHQSILFPFSFRCLQCRQRLQDIALQSGYVIQLMA